MEIIKNKYKYKEQALLAIIDRILWMSARYAHGRSTYAPGDVRRAVEDMKIMYPDWKPKKDETIKPPKDDEVGGMRFRSDYLDDIFNP